MLEATASAFRHQGSPWADPHQEFIRSTRPTSCLSAAPFGGIRGIIQKRTGKQGMGFGSEIKGKEEEQTDHLLAESSA